MFDLALPFIVLGMLWAFTRRIPGEEKLHDNGKGVGWLSAEEVLEQLGKR